MSLLMSQSTYLVVVCCTAPSPARCACPPVMAMAERANQRIDLMDQRVDGMEDTVRDLREHVLRKEKELEDMQLEKQIETLRRELEEAKTGA